jgi:hypothetical protein
MTRLHWLAVAATALFAPLSEACDYCLISQGISPLQTQQGAGLRWGQRYTSLDSVYHGTDEIPNPGVKEQYWTTDIAGFYGVNDRILLLVNVPLRRTDGHGELVDGEDGTTQVEQVRGDATGVGDVSLLARYTVFERHSLDSTTLVAGVLGVKFATGSTDQHNAEGEYLDSHLQLGTGSTDPLLGFSIDHASGRASISGNILASFANDGEVGDASHRFGDSVNYDVTGKYRLTPHTIGQSANALFVSLGVHGEWRDYEHLEGARLPDTGGNTVYVAPGVQYAIGGKWIIEGTYQRAVYHDLNDTQLGEDYRVFGTVTLLL